MMLPPPRPNKALKWFPIAAIVAFSALIVAATFIVGDDGKETTHESNCAVVACPAGAGPADGAAGCSPCPGGTGVAGGTGAGGEPGAVVAGASGSPQAPAVTVTPTSVPTAAPATLAPPAAPAPIEPPGPVVTEPAREPPVINPGDPVAIDLSFYVCSGAPPGYSDGYCGTAADGTQVYEGMVACGYAWSLGTRFTIDGDPTGRTYTCHDRGLGPWHWLDVFFWTYADGRAWRDAVGYGPVYARAVE